jgi:hypothetical protein
MKNSTFKISKTTKRMMAFIADDAKRHHFKNMMIDAQLAAEEATKQNRKSKGDKE